MDESIQDGVRHRRIVDEVVPALDGQLASHDGGSATHPVIQKFEQVGSPSCRQRVQSEVVQDQQLQLGQLLPQLP